MTKELLKKLEIVCEQRPNLSLGSVLGIVEDLGGAPFRRMDDRRIKVVLNYMIRSKIDDTASHS